MPESSTAIFAATTEPAPAKSVYRLDMSDSTPILITPSETCACAVPSDSAAATAMPIIVRLNAFIVLLRSRNEMPQRRYTPRYSCSLAMFASRSALRIMSTTRPCSIT